MLMLTCVCFQDGNNALCYLALSTTKINKDERVEFARWLVEEKRVEADKPHRYGIDMREGRLDRQHAQHSTDS